jgi:bifunctional non-homologous end joining protein LigD
LGILYHLVYNSPVLKTKMLTYVIHDHTSMHHHYDLRLEMDGALKSWAIPKEPPEKKGDKRLAIAVEDHPLSYAKFEGKIPEGNRGAGYVMIWDSGTYELIEATEDKILVYIHGIKLKGLYHLINFHPPKNWLLIKS